jgi:hypothetical protein
MAELLANHVVPRVRNYGGTTQVEDYRPFDVRVLYAQVCVHSTCPHVYRHGLQIHILANVLCCLYSVDRVLLPIAIMCRTLHIATTVVTFFELLLSVALLTLFLSAYPDRYRTALWRDGGSKGWNSDPTYRIYLYANYQNMPPMPLVWDERCVSCHKISKP